MPAIRPIAAAAFFLLLPLVTLAQAPVPEASPTASGGQETKPAPGGEAAQAPAPAIDSGKLADNVIFETIVKLRLQDRVAARIEQVVNMLNQKFELKGNYYKDTGYRVRLQLDLVGAGDSGSTMLQVCDGKILWEYQQVMGMKNYRKRAIAPILKKLEDPNLDDDFRKQMMTMLGFGGPEALLSGFQAVIGFDQFADVEVDGVPTYKLGGKWKKRDGLFGANDRPLSPTSPLPPYIPSNIQIYIDKANLWPYRIEMIGNVPSMIEEDTRDLDPVTGRPKGRPRAAPKVEPSNITLRYTLLPDSELKPDEQFVFSTPRDASNLIDETEQFMTLLDQMIQYKLNEKKAKEAAAGDSADAIIKVDPLNLPSTPPAPIGIPPAEPSVPK